MSNWLITIFEGTAFVYKRNYWFCGLYPVPWAFSGESETTFSTYQTNDIVDAALDYIVEQDIDANVLIKFKPWD